MILGIEEDKFLNKILPIFIREIRKKSKGGYYDRVFFIYQVSIFVCVNLHWAITPPHKRNNLNEMIDKLINILLPATIEVAKDKFPAEGEGNESVDIH